jgi:hypothetical protein
MGAVVPPSIHKRSAVGIKERLMGSPEFSLTVYLFVDAVRFF